MSLKDVLAYESDEDKRIEAFLQAPAQEQNDYLDNPSMNPSREEEEGLHFLWEFLMEAHSLQEASFRKFQQSAFIYQWVRDCYSMRFLGVFSSDDAKAEYLTIIEECGGAEKVSEIISERVRGVKRDLQKEYGEYLERRQRARELEKERRKALYPPLYQTPGEKEGSELEAKLTLLEKNENRAESQMDEWEWDPKHFPPRWVNSRTRKKDGTYKNSYHRFSKTGECDPAREEGDIAGCPAKQFNPDVKCKHEIAYGVYIRERQKENGL